MTQREELGSLCNNYRVRVSKDVNLFASWYACRLWSGHKNLKRPYRPLVCDLRGPSLVETVLLF